MTCYGQDYTELLYPLTGLGACLAATGETEAAREVLERALRVGKDGSFPPGYRATTLFELARLLDDDARASKLGNEALADAEKEPGTPQVAAIEAWLAGR